MYLILTRVVFLPDNKNCVIDDPVIMYTANNFVVDNTAVSKPKTKIL